MTDAGTADDAKMVIKAGKGRGVIYAVFGAENGFTVGAEGVVTAADRAALADALLSQADALLSQADALLSQADARLDPACRCQSCAAIRAARAALAPVRSQRVPSERPH